MKLKRILGGLGVIALAAVGTQLVAVQASSAHTPSASVTCTAWSISATNYEAAQHNTYSYSIDGGAATTGTFARAFSQSGTFAAGTGDHTLVGYVYQNGDPAAKYSKTYHLTSTGCPQYVAIPVAPLPTPPTCSVAGAATIPSDTAAVHWTLVGNVATATAQNTKFSDGTASKSFIENVLPQLDANSDGCAVHLTVVAPVFADGNCDTAPSLNGATDGTGYTVVIVGDAAFGHHVVVTFTASPNYRLDGQTVYTFDYAAQPDCRTIVSPVNPTVTEATCDPTTGLNGGFHITSATTEGTTYTVNETDHVVTATATVNHKLGNLADGWTMAEDSDTVATFTVVPAADPICLIDSTSTAPSFSDDVCKADSNTGSSVTLPSSTGVNYRIDGALTAAGTHAAADGSKVTVTAEAQENYNLTGAVTWTHTFGTAPTCSEVGGVHVTRPPAHQAVAAASTPLASTGVPTMSLLLIGGLLGLIGGGLCLATIRWGVRA